MQQYVGIYSLKNCSTCFGCPSYPSSRVHKTVTAASGTGHITYLSNNLPPKWPIGHFGGRYDIHITVIFAWASSIPRISTKMNCYSSNNYKQYNPTSNNCSSNIINHPILLPKNILLKIHILKHGKK